MTSRPDVVTDASRSTPATGEPGAAPAPGLLLRARDLRVVHDGRTALDGVSLQVRPGQLLAVTGPSGAGKTSLLWALAGLRRPDSGEVELGEADGSPVQLDAAKRALTASAGRDAYAAAGVVIVPQGNALATVLTAAENVVVPLLAAGVPAEHAHALAATTLDEVGLAGSGTQLVEELSGGQQQRVAVARGLAQRGRVLLADEPTSELDAVNRARVVSLLRAEAERGATVVMATHDPEGAEACDGELHLDDGVPTWVRPLPGQEASSIEGAHGIASELSGPGSTASAPSASAPSASGPGASGPSASAASASGPSPSAASASGPSPSAPGVADPSASGPGVAETSSSDREGAGRDGSVDGHENPGRHRAG
jgi:putative ABC transport system ATP-binding protein